MTGEKYKTTIGRKLDKLTRKNNSGLVFYLVYKCKLNKTSEDGLEETIEVPFYSETRRILHMVECDDPYQEAMYHINEKMRIYVSEKSGWILI